MSAKVRQIAVPQPGNAMPQLQHGRATDTATPNTIGVVNPGVIAAAGVNSHAANITPRVGGKLNVSGSISGNSNTADAALLFELLIGATVVASAIQRTEASLVGGEARFGATLICNDQTARPVGVAVAVTIRVTASAGTVTTPIGHAIVNAQEVPV